MRKITQRKRSGRHARTGRNWSAPLKPLEDIASALEKFVGSSAAEGVFQDEIGEAHRQCQGKRGDDQGLDELRRRMAVARMAAPQTIAMLDAAIRTGIPSTGLRRCRAKAACEPSARQARR